MASSYLAGLQNRQQELLHRLITHILPLQVGEDNYETAMEFCAGNLNPKYHRYKDVNPREVRELYAGLSDRMEQHSQLSKASRLRQLCSCLSSLGLEGKDGDMDAALLLLLFGLANKPLQSGKVLLPQAGAPTSFGTLVGAAPAVGGEVEAEEGSSSDDGSSTWSSESELSDWEGDEESAAAGVGRAGSADVAQSSPDASRPPSPMDMSPVAKAGDASRESAGVAREAVAVHSVPVPTLPCTPEARLPPRARAARSVPKPAADAAGRLHMPAFPPMPSAAHSLAGGATRSLPLVTPQPADLVPCIARVRLQSLPFLAPQPNKCLSDQHIAHQVLNLLLNDSSTCFECYPAASNPAPPAAASSCSHPNPRYQPVPGLHVPYLSPGMLHSLLCEFAEAGSQVAWLQAVIAASTHAAAGQAIQVPGIADGLRASPCCQAMLQAAASQLRAISRPLIELQQANMDRRAACPGAHATPTLLQLREQCSAPMRRLAALHEAVRLALRAQSAAERCASKSGSGGGGEHRMGGQPGRPGPEHPKRGGHVAATASSMLLDALHLMLESDTLTTGPEGQVLQQQLLHLFLCALTPLLDGLHTWLYDNWEDHFPEDFFVAPGQPLPETHPLFWSEAFRLLLRHSPVAGSPTSYGSVLAEHVDTAQIACPRFLQPVACEIFSAGKSLRLLKNSEQAAMTAAGALPAGVAPLVAPPLRAKSALTRARHHAPLQQQFLDHLSGFLAGHELCPPAAVPPASGPGLQTMLVQDGRDGQGGAPGEQPAAAVRQWAQHDGRLEGPEAPAPQPLLPPAQHCDPATWPTGPLPPVAPQAAPGAHAGGALQGSPQSILLHASAPLSFSTRMAAAGVRRSTLMHAPGAEEEGSQGPPLLGAGSSPGARQGSGGVARLSTAHARDGAGTGLGGVGDVHQTDRWGLGGLLESQCSSIAAAMCRGEPSLGWEAGDGGLQGCGTIRPDVAQRLRAALLPGPLGHSSTSWLRPREQAHAQLDWLLEEPCLDLPPVELMLEHCLLGILRQRAEDIGQCLLGCLLSDWGLLAELSALKNLFLLASPSAQAWADRTLSGMLFHGRPLEDRHEYELDVALQEVIAEAGQDEALPAVDTISVMLDKERVVEMRSKAAATKAHELGRGPSQVHLSRSVHCALHSVLELEGLQFRYQPSWLMSMIGGSDSISSYNNALVFLMQIRAARMALEDARVRSWKSWKYQALVSSPYSRGPSGLADPLAVPAGAVPSMPLLSVQQPRPTLSSGLGRRPSMGALGAHGFEGAASLNAKEEDLVMQEMSHFVSNLEQFVVDRLLFGAWMQLEQDLDQARTLDDVVHHHRTFLATLDRQAGRGTHGDTAGAWKHLVFGINKVLDQVLLFCSAQRALTAYQTKAGGSKLQLDGGVTGIQDSLRIASSEFRRLHRYLLKFLGNKTHKIGGEPDLENLIMRINFNDFYDNSFM